MHGARVFGAGVGPSRKRPSFATHTSRFGHVIAPPYEVMRAHALDARTPWIQLWAAGFAQRPWS